MGCADTAERPGSVCEDSGQYCMDVVMIGSTTNVTALCKCLDGYDSVDGVCLSKLMLRLSYIFNQLGMSLSGN